MLRKAEIVPDSLQQQDTHGFRIRSRSSPTIPTKRQERHSRFRLIEATFVYQKKKTICELVSCTASLDCSRWHGTCSKHSEANRNPASMQWLLGTRIVEGPEPGCSRPKIAGLPSVVTGRLSD